LGLAAIGALGVACRGSTDTTTPSTSGGSHTAGEVKDGKYEVCSADQYQGDSHLNLWDEIEIRKGEPVSNVVFTTYNPPRKAPPGKEDAARSMSKPSAESVPMITCCSGERLGGTKAFAHQGKPVLHAVVIENAPKGERESQCTREPLLTIRFCSPTRDDKGSEAWSCGDHRNPHGGDVHAQPQAVGGGGSG